MQNERVFEALNYSASRAISKSTMQTPFEFMIGLTYTRRGRRGRRKDGFMSFISGMSVASIALGVAALIIVLSVMNGFQKEVRDRMLSVIPHVEIRASKGALTDVEGVEKVLQAQSDVVAVAPFVEGQGLFSSGAVVRGAVVKGIDPAKEPGVSELAQSVSGAELSDLKPKAFQVILGQALARQLRVHIGDKVALLVPEGNMTPAGLIPRMKQLTVAGYFSSGHYEYDSTYALVNIEDAAALYRTGGPQGLRVADRGQARVGASIRTLCDGLVAAKPHVVRSRAGRKTHDGDHPLSYCFGRRFRARFHIGDDREGKAV